MTTVHDDTGSIIRDIESRIDALMGMNSLTHEEIFAELAAIANELIEQYLRLIAALA